MAEFAAASAAAGIISLGLDVCKGLFKYCDSLKTQSRDVRAGSLQADRMEALLEILAQVIPQQDDSDSALRQVRICLNDCGSGLRDLKAMLLRHTPGGPSNPLRRAAYPFSKADISALKDVVSGLQSKLQFALDIYQLTSQARSAAVQERISDHIQAMLRSQPNSAAIDMVLREVRASQIDMHRMILESTHQQEAQSSTLQSRFLAERIHSEHDGGGEVSDDTSNTLANSAAHEEADEDILRTPESLLRKTPFRHGTGVVTKSCRCRPDKKNRKWNFTKILQFESGSASRHSPECPLYATSRRTEQRSIRLRCVWQGNRQAIGALVSLTTSIGSGGAILDRALSCRRIIDFDHPSFRLPISSQERYGHGWMGNTQILTSSEIFELRRHLYVLLSSGVLCPTDMDYNGNTLFGVSNNC